VSRQEDLLPMGLAEGCRLVTDVRRDQVLTYSDVEVPLGGVAHRLRREQDVLFPVGRRSRDVHQKHEIAV
jgi:predicted homoserine dehydrogenase-like protein